jgi:nicotinate-nucleotide adenylyltransferase
MRLGIFGGSFDPVHNGHLALASACHTQAALDEVWFTPTAIQPLKLRGPHATNIQRVEMLQLAIEAMAGTLPLGTGRGQGASTAPPISAWRVCTLEIDRGGFSYTVDTLRQLHTELPEAQLFFMIGADAIRDVPKWKEAAEIFRLAIPLVVSRAGRPAPDMATIAPLCTPQTRPRLVEMPAVDISSTEIRRRIAAGESIESLVPEEVAAYIRQHGIYR